MSGYIIVMYVFVLYVCASDLAFEVERVRFLRLCLGRLEDKRAALHAARGPHLVALSAGLERKARVHPTAAGAVAFFFSSRRRHTRCGRDWSSDVCSSDLAPGRGRRSYEHAPRAQQLAEVGLTGPGIAARVRALASEESLAPS